MVEKHNSKIYGFKIKHSNLVELMGPYTEDIISRSKFFGFYCDLYSIIKKIKENSDSVVFGEKEIEKETNSEDKKTLIEEVTELKEDLEKSKKELETLKLKIPFHDVQKFIPQINPAPAPKPRVAPLPRVIDLTLKQANERYLQDTFEKSILTVDNLRSLQKGINYYFDKGLIRVVPKNVLLQKIDGKILELESKKLNKI